jgi:ABC-type ATPase involved in cell division
VSLLSVESVSKRYRRGNREFVALREVSMTVEPAELVVVLGTRRSGRSTLLRVAAGLERADEGRVMFDGADLAKDRRALGRRLCYCHGSFSTMQGERVVDHVAAPLLAQRKSRRLARLSAESALERAGIADCASMLPDELDWSERVRVAIARGLAPEPSLLVVDDPTAQAAVLQSDPLLRLLRSLASDSGPAVLMSTDDAMCVSGADRVMLLDEGQLRPEIDTEPAEVVPLNARRLGA